MHHSGVQDEKPIGTVSGHCIEVRDFDPSNSNHRYCSRLESNNATVYLAVPLTLGKRYTIHVWED